MVNGTEAPKFILISPTGATFAFHDRIRLIFDAHPRSSHCPTDISVLPSACRQNNSGASSIVQPGSCVSFVSFVGYPRRSGGRPSIPGDSIVHKAYLKTGSTRAAVDFCEDRVRDTYSRGNHTYRRFVITRSHTIRYAHVHRPPWHHARRSPPSLAVRVLILLWTRCEQVKITCRAGTMAIQTWSLRLSPQ